MKRAMKPFKLPQSLWIAVVFTLFAVSGAQAQQTSGPQSVVHLMGLVGVKDHAKGTLHIESGKLHFVHGTASTDIDATSIHDVLTGADSRKSVGKTVGFVSMAAPYGGGRFLSLFRTKVDILTVAYRDTDDSLHGVIFIMPAGTAEGIKNQLVAQGAPTSSADETTTAPSGSSTSPADKGNRNETHSTREDVDMGGHSTCRPALSRRDRQADEDESRRNSGHDGRLGRNPAAC
jgi:hypothetical protein